MTSAICGPSARRDGERLYPRRPQDVDRQRRNCRRPCRQCGRRRGTRPPRPGVVHRARVVRPGPGAGAQARQARLPGVAHRRTEIPRRPDSRDENLLGGQKRSSSTSWPRRAKWWQVGKRSGSATLGTFEQTRPMVAAQAIGIARAALEYATDLCHPAVRRSVRPIMDQPGHRFSARRDLATQIDAARLLTWRASWMAATGRLPFERGEGSMSKMAASEVGGAGPLSGPFRPSAAGATSTTIRSRSGIEMPSCTPSSRAPARFSAS